MVKTLVVRLASIAVKTSRNPHFWVVLAMSAILLFIYQAWPWRWPQFTDGVWRFLPWLSDLDFLPVQVEYRLHVFGVLFWIPIAYASITLSWPGGVLAWLLSLIWVLPAARSWGGGWEVVNLSLLLLPVLPVVVVTTERRLREKEKRHFLEREQERRAWVARLMDTQETERKRIAQELHDETLQTLLVIANTLDSLAPSDASDEQSQRVLRVKEKLFQTMDDLRRLSMNLRPSILDNFGLVQGVRWLVDHACEGGCQVSTCTIGEAPKMSSLAEITVFRVVQEAVSNIQRHAHAQNAVVTLDFRDDQLSLEIRDDGLGFEPGRLGPTPEHHKLGIIGMQERVRAIGGTVSLESRPGAGTRLSATIPYSGSGEIIQGEDARFQTHEEGLGSGSDVEFLKELNEVSLDGRLGDPQSRTDLLVGHPTRRQSENLHVPGRYPLPGLRRVRDRFLHMAKRELHDGFRDAGSQH